MPKLSRPAARQYVAPTHYLGVSGLGEEAVTVPAQDPRAGFFGFERRLTRTDIAQQSSRLLVALETSRASGAWTAAGRSTVRGLDEEGPWLGASAQFGGNHPGGANALFADGSVRFVRESVDPQVFRAMATVQGSKGVESIAGD
jgi:prepilin-type processing-associated H-X9-DG protein